MLELKNENRGVSLLEVLISLALIGVIFGALVPMLGTFGQRQQLNGSALMLLGDLRQTQQFSRVTKDGYNYYSLRFYSGLGEDSDRIGYKILRYEPQGVVPPIDMNNSFTIIKSSQPADNAELVENCFFGKKIVIDSSSEFSVGDYIIFSSDGSATTDGSTLLPTSSDEIILTIISDTSQKKTITINPLPGNVKLQ